MADQDNDVHKGVIESDKPRQRNQSSLQGQLPHRPQDQRIQGSDTDFPEPGENPEHSGQDIEPDMDPGMHQKQNQNDRKDDPLAA